MIDLFKSKRASSVLGLALDGNRLEVIALRRSNGTLRVGPSVSAPLALSPLTDDPELVGREIRNHLDQAGIRERRCAVCLPLRWVLTLQTKLPDLPEGELAGFLQLEAERGFHSGPEDLFTVQSIFKAPSGESYATLMAVPRNNLASIERVLRAARLKPLAFALGATALQPPAAAPERVFTLALRVNTIDLQVSGGGGIIALRSLDAAIETEGGQRRISADFIARELRITLGQLPGGFAEGPGKLKVFGQGEAVRQFVNEISPRLGPLGLQLEVADKASGAAFDRPLPGEMTVSPAVAVAATWVRESVKMPDFLPPRVSPWQQWVGSGMSKRRLIMAGKVAGAVAGCVVLAFAIQGLEIHSLESKWQDMSPTVAELKSDQDQITKYQSWYDRTFRDLRVLKELAYAFPMDGVVRAKTVEIRDLSAVTCTGVADDNADFVRVHDALEQDTNEISNLHTEVRGQKPMQFILSFQWEGAPANGN